MSSDPRLKAAVAHWGPRFVANGVVLTDFEEITSSIASYDDWCGAWSKRAAHHEKLGREALAKKHCLTAGESLQRAGVYYHFASFLFVHDQAQMKAAHKKQIECRQFALPYLRPPGECVEIPYQGRPSPASCASQLASISPPRAEKRCLVSVAFFLGGIEPDRHITRTGGLSTPAGLRRMPASVLP